MLLALGLFIYLDSSDDEKPSSSSVAPPPPTTQTSAAGAPGGAWGLSSMRGGGTHAERRVYTTGTRLDELLRWPALDGALALLAYLRNMDWEDKEALLKALPQIANCILGLDTAASGAAGGRGWLNEQADMLHEPHRNVRAASQLHSALIELLSARVEDAAAATAEGKAPGGSATPTAVAADNGSVDGQMGALFERLLDAARGREGQLSPHYSFFSKHLPMFTRLAIANGRLDLVPLIFRDRLQAAAPAAPVRTISVQESAVGAAATTSTNAAGGTTGVPTMWLILPAWDYFLYCLCLWPLSERGGQALEDHKSTPSTGHVGAVATVR
eukprot:scaffold62234_cov32-Tisochrysis_lutea.AAC.4